MRKFWKIFFGSIISILILLFCVFRNHIRQQICRNFSVSESRLVLEEQLEEENFKVEIYDIGRTFRNKWVARYNYFFNDELMAVYLPLEKYKFRNLVLKPLGSDEFNEKSVFRFNTLFFKEDFEATSGIIDDDELVSVKSPRKNRLAINDQGELMNSTDIINSEFNDVLQAPYTFSVRNKAGGFRSLHYRQFLAIQNGDLIFISGNGNSLISWLDVQSFMKMKNIESVIALDGGASVDYFFQGANHDFNFSSIPFRRLWFNLNSPYYLEGYTKNS